MRNMQFVLRKSGERGQADHGWLQSFNTFSFAMYQDISHQQYGPLRVINEDRAAPLAGFGKHTHRECEIFSYVVSGELQHRDSNGNVEVFRRGDIQLTSTGTGVTHSVQTHGLRQVHFLQIWAVSSTPHLPPRYYTRHFTDAEKTNQWARVVAPSWAEGVFAKRNAEGPAPVESHLTLYATILSKGKSLARSLEGMKGYVHLIQTSGINTGAPTGASVRIRDGSGSELVLREGDGAYIKANVDGASLEVVNVGDRSAEILVFDLSETRNG